MSEVSIQTLSPQRVVSAVLRQLNLIDYHLSSSSRDHGLIVPAL